MSVFVRVDTKPEPLPDLRTRNGLTTPEPQYTPEPPPIRLNDGPPRLDQHEKNRLRVAAYRATQVYPGPVGRLIQREIVDAADFGCRFVNGSLIAELVEEVMRPRPEATQDRLLTGTDAR